MEVGNRGKGILLHLYFNPINNSAVLHQFVHGLTLAHFCCSIIFPLFFLEIVCVGPTFKVRVFSVLQEGAGTKVDQF